MDNPATLGRPALSPAIAFGILALAIWPVPSVLADTFVVDTEIDSMHIGCSGLVVGDCSLRGAIERANQNPGLDQITFGFGADHFVLSIVGQDDANQVGDLDLLEEVEIMATSPVVIDASLIGDRVLDVRTSSPVFSSLSNLTLTGGSAPAGVAGFEGGGLHCLDSALILAGVDIVGNGPVENGGGVWTLGCDLLIGLTTIADNTATSIGGGLGLLGGTMLLQHSAIVLNHAASSGGLVVAFFSDAQVENATISGNSSSPLANASAIEVYNSDVGLTFVTVVSDSFAPTLFHAGSGVTTLTGTLLVGTCDGASLLATGGGNLESPGDTCQLDPSLDLVGVADARLKPLGDHGGRTPLHMPRASSPVVDHPFAGLVTCPGFDQRREHLRPIDGDGDGVAICDIGAVERDEAFLDGFESGNTSAWSTAIP